MLNFKVFGEGYPLVFLHGFLESNSMWNYLALYELQCQLIFIELPGHGNSMVCESLPPSIQLMAEKVLEVTEELKLPHFSIIGHSMGGYVALEMKQLNSNIEKVVLLNSNPWSDSPQKIIDRKRVASIVYDAKELFLKEAIPNLFRDPFFNKKEVRELIKEASEMSADAIAFASLAMSARLDYSHEVHADGSQYYIIQGEEDKIVIREAMEELVDKGPNYFLIPEAGHMCHIEQPKRVVEILKVIFIDKKRKPSFRYR